MSFDDMPAPLVPADVDLRDFGFMPLHVGRLRDSDLMVLATGDEFRAAVLLWCFSWHQQPAASLPDDDRVLAARSGAGPAWRKVKEMALRGFVKCSDGRLYHPVIAEVALDAWARRAQFRETRDNEEDRKVRYRKSLKELSAELRELGVTVPKNRSIEALEQAVEDAKAKSAGTQRGRSGDAPVDAPGDTARRSGDALDSGQGQGHGQGQEKRKERATRAPPCPDGVADQVWSDWLQLRKAKRAPVTETVLAGAADEARKAGLTLEAFLRVWCRRGTQGLEAAWLAPQERGRPAAVETEPEWRREQRERNEAFLGPAAARRRTTTTVDMEAHDAPAKLLG